jgi:hypothetical protein
MPSGSRFLISLPYLYLRPRFQTSESDNNRFTLGLSYVQDPSDGTFSLAIPKSDEIVEKIEAPFQVERLHNLLMA